jgi:pyruvate ferredoxin oxidoreductase delta subunit
MSSIVRSFCPEVDAKKCQKCGICQTFCPEGTVMLSGGAVVFDYRYCKGCGVCANECRFKAITMVREEG